jgi:hypothetical protein
VAKGVYANKPEDIEALHELAEGHIVYGKCYIDFDDFAAAIVLAP